MGWMTAECETATLARDLVETTCTRQGIAREQLILHADNGGPMRAKTLALLLDDLGVSASHSRRTPPTAIRSWKRSSRR
jgi:putative transposase